MQIKEKKKRAICFFKGIIAACHMNNCIQNLNYSWKVTVR